MDDSRKSFTEIEPLNEDELDKDLRFLFHNRSETVDQFVEEAIPVIKYHVNQVIGQYQERLLDELSSYLRGEIAGVMLRVKREQVIHPNATIGRTPDEVAKKTAKANKNEDVTAW